MTDKADPVQETIGVSTTPGSPTEHCSDAARVFSEIELLEKKLWDLLKNLPKQNPLNPLNWFTLGPGLQTEKHLMIALERLQALRRELSLADGRPSEATELGFRRFLRMFPSELEKEPEKLYTYVWELDETLRRDLVWIGDTQFLCVALRCELMPDEHDEPTWKEHFGAVDLNGLLGAMTSSTTQIPTITQSQREFVIRHLVSLYEARSLRERVRRTRVAVKGRYLHIVSGLMLAALLALLAVMLFVIPAGAAANQSLPPRLEVVVVALAGALGAMLMHLLRSRDEMTRIRELFAGSFAMLAQPLIGAVSAVVFWLILKSQLISIGPPNMTNVGWGLTTALGFLAGFSEPFFLNTLNRFAESAAGDKEKRKQPGQRDK